MACPEWCASGALAAPVCQACGGPTCWRTPCPACTTSVGITPSKARCWLQPAGPNPACLQAPCHLCQHLLPRYHPPPAQFVCTRQLSPTVSGEYSWVVGPPEASGMSLGLTRRTEKLMLTGRLEVGSAAMPCLPSRCLCFVVQL